MRLTCAEAARRLGVSPLQVIVEIAAMNQPPEACFPDVDAGLVETIRVNRRVRMGLPPVAPRPHVAAPASASTPGPLPVADEAAAILDKLVRKSYGLRPVRVFTLVQKWVHDARAEHVDELVAAGFMEWVDADREAVRLVADRLADTERLVDAYRARVATR